MDALLGAAETSHTGSARLLLKHPGNREFTGGDLLAQSLYALGIRVAFGLHGGHLDSFLYGCLNIGIKPIGVRHESVAVQAAEGYAKISGRVGTAFVTANSGFANALPGLASAGADRSPVLVVTSSAPSRDVETNALQGLISQDVIATPLVKFACKVTCVEEIPRVVAHAYRTAVSGKPGPVLLDFPIDILFSPPDPFRISWGSIARSTLSRPAPDPNAVEMALKLLKRAERPCLITGTGAKAPDAAAELLKFVQTTGIPVFNSTKYGGLLPSGHPLRAGPASNLAKLATDEDKQQPDLIILLGVRTGFFLGSRAGAVIPDGDCKLIQIDVDGAEIGRSHAIDLGIVSDSTLALRAFNAALKTLDQPIDVQLDWIRKATMLKAAANSSEEASPEMTDGRAHPYHAIKKVFEALVPGSIVIMDGGEASCWQQDLVEQYSNASSYIISTGYLGFLGNGWGYALGAALADPTRRIVNMQGDGSAGFHIAELDTYSRHKLNILTVVCNNACWGMSQSGQELMFGDSTNERPVSKLADTAWEKIAEGFGCESARVERVADVTNTVKRLVNVRGPSCLNLVISDKPIHPVTQAMVGKTDDESVIVVPYYDNIPRSTNWRDEDGPEIMDEPQGAE